MTIRERWEAFWSKLQWGPSFRPTLVSIPQNHVEPIEEGVAGGPFEPGKHYFQIRLNEMGLPYGRNWFATYDPLVQVVSEFGYGKGQVVPMVVPLVVGPASIKNGGGKLPKDMAFFDTRVAGLHPYRGGRLSLTLVLYRVQRQNYARKMLDLIEGTSKVLDFQNTLGMHTKVADVLLDGVEALLALGQTDPVMGFRKEFDTDGECVAPGFFALINADEAALNSDTLWIRDRKLMRGPELKQAVPFRETEYVLFSILQTDRRKDPEWLPFYSRWERVVQEASGVTPAHWKSALSNMLSLYQEMSVSPDLTASQAADLAKEYRAEAKRIHDTAVKIGGDLGPIMKEASDFDEIRRRSLEILRD